MTFCLDLGLDGPYGSDLGRLYCLDLFAVLVAFAGTEFSDSVCAISLDGDGGIGRLGLVNGIDPFDGVHIDGRFIDPAQSLVYILKFAFLNIKDRVVAHHMQDDLGHTAWFSGLGAGKDDILHLAAAKALCPLFAEYPRHRVRYI